ncbi:MAG: VOC family protein [Bacteroidetes bacterium]|nr:VOC family protein [Bacteroidota bacterium]
MHPHIDFLDHIALRVEDLAASAEWYERVLGLKRHQRADWGPFPILLLAGSTGLALFPKKETQIGKENPRFADHFAFRISTDQIPVAHAHLEKLGIEFEVQDHPPFRSTYFWDPDGYRVELMAQITSDSYFGSL